MCLASRTACGSPSSTLSWQCLWWSLITYTDSQGAKHPTMRVESVETGFTDPDWALLSGLSPAKECIRYSWDKAFGTECVPIVLSFLSREISSFDKGHWFTHLLGADNLVYTWVSLIFVLSDIFQHYLKCYTVTCPGFQVLSFCLEDKPKKGCNLMSGKKSICRVFCDRALIWSPSSTLFIPPLFTSTLMSSLYCHLTTQ